MILPWLPEDRVAIIAAHPDDEVVGIGGHMPLLREPVVIHVTDGAPRNLYDAHRYGFHSAEEYAAARREELRAALALAGIGEDRCRRIDVPDQESAFHLTEIARRLDGLLAGVDVIVTHPYEGGHPDHDATAFAAHAAAFLLRKPLIEFTSYHAREGGFESGVFLPVPGTPEYYAELSPPQRERKLRMFECFTTQKGLASAFGVHAERFRPAPRYDFTQPPNGGRAYYENFDWGMRVDRWCHLTADALRELDLCGLRF